MLLITIMIIINHRY